MIMSMCRGCRHCGFRRSCLGGLGTDAVTKEGGLYSPLELARILRARTYAVQTMGQVSGMTAAERGLRVQRLGEIITVARTQAGRGRPAGCPEATWQDFLRAKQAAESAYAAALRAPTVTRDREAARTLQRAQAAAAAEQAETGGAAAEEPLPLPTIGGAGLSSVLQSPLFLAGAVAVAVLMATSGKGK